MARKFGENQCLWLASPPLTTKFSVSIWCIATVTLDNVFTVSNEGLFSVRVMTIFPSGFNGGTTIGYSTQALGDWSTGQWTHIAYRYTVGNLHKIYVNGVSSQAGSPLTALVPNYFTVGGRYSGSSMSSALTNGSVAHVALWNDTLTDAEAAALYNGGLGMDPRYVRRVDLVAYWPLIRNDLDYIGGYNLTAYNNPTFTDFPLEKEWNKNKSYGSKGAV